MHNDNNITFIKRIFILFFDILDLKTVFLRYRPKNCFFRPEICFLDPKTSF